VLWIPIRKNPQVLAGSESEKKFGYGFVLYNEKFFEKSQIKHLKMRKKIMFFYWKLVQVPYHIPGMKAI
jgi:hypothetical protein